MISHLVSIKRTIENFEVVEKLQRMQPEWLCIVPIRCVPVHDTIDKSEIFLTICCVALCLQVGIKAVVLCIALQRRGIYIYMCVSGRIGLWILPGEDRAACERAQTKMFSFFFYYRVDATSIKACASLTFSVDVQCLNQVDCIKK